MKLWPSLLFVGSLVVAGPAAGQTIPAGGSEVFRFALHENKFTPATTKEEVLRNPTQSLIVAIGNTDGLNNQVSGFQLRSFLISGGSVLIATDWSNAHEAFRGWTWGAEFRISTTGQGLRGQPGRCYRGVPSQPLVEPVFPRLPDPLLHDIFGRLQRPVATSRPTEMRYDFNLAGMSVVPLARYPPGTVRESDGRPVREEFNNFAVAVKPIPGRSPVPFGRMLVVADQSAFANGMLGFVEDPNPPGYTFDNGNWDFLNRSIAWLQAGPPQARTKCLFIENGEIQKQFAVELPPGANPPGAMPDLPPEVIANLVLNLADPVLNEMQERDVAGKILDRNPELVRRMIKYGLFGLTILFALIALRRLLRAYRKPETTPLPRGVAEAMLPRGGVVRQRTDAQLEVGNLYEAARRRVRDRFDRLGGAPGRDGQMPPVLVANDVRDAELLRSAVGWLWPIGYADTPVPVPPAEWDRVNALLERLTRRAAGGDWSFGVEVA